MGVISGINQKAVWYKDKKYICTEHYNYKNEKIIVIELDNRLITEVKNLSFPLDVFDYEYFNSIVIEKIKDIEQLNRLISK